MDQEAVLITIQEQLLQQIEDMTLNPKPDYGVGPVSISWGAHFNNLMAALEVVQRKLAEASPQEIRSVIL